MVLECLCLQEPAHMQIATGREFETNSALRVVIRFEFLLHWKFNNEVIEHWTVTTIIFSLSFGKSSSFRPVIEIKAPPQNKKKRISTIQTSTP